MSTSSIINVTLELLCTVICIILVICLRFSSDSGSKLNRHFSRLLLINLSLLASSIISWVFDGSSFAGVYPVLVVSNFMLYLLWCILKADASNYMFSFISARAKISNKYLYAIWIINAASIILLIISQFTGLYYYIDERIRFQRNRLYWIAYVGPILLYLLGLFMVFRHRKSLAKKDTVTLLSFEIIPVISLFLQIPQFGVFLVNTASTISLLIIFARIQMEENNRLELALADSRIDIMLSQIRPHFLYNSLVVIRQLCKIDPQLAEETVMDFSQYLRSNLDSLSLKKPILFEKEL